MLLKIHTVRFVQGQRTAIPISLSIPGMASMSTVSGSWPARPRSTAVSLPCPCQWPQATRTARRGCLRRGPRVHFLKRTHEQSRGSHWSNRMRTGRTNANLEQVKDAKRHGRLRLAQEMQLVELTTVVGDGRATSSGACRPRSTAAMNFASRGICSLRIPQRTSSGVPMRRPFTSPAISGSGRPIPHARMFARRNNFAIAWPPPKSCASIAN